MAAIFYGQAKASPADVKKLAQILNLNELVLTENLGGFPDRGRALDMPRMFDFPFRLAW